MKKIKTVAAMLAALALASPAIAGGKGKWEEPVVETPPAPAVAPAYGWSGAYGGVTLGYARGSAAGASGSGAMYGGFLGYNQQMGNTVFGGEVDLLGSNISIGNTDVEYLARLKGRLGFA